MSNDKQVLPVLHWLEVVIAFVSSVEVIYYVTDTVELLKRDTKTENTLSPHTDVCCSIWTKLCMMVEKVSAIILPTIGFGSRQ